MIYALTITVAAGLLLLALIGFAVALVRRVAGVGDWPWRGRWRWYPTPLGLLVLLPLAGLLLWRLFPELLFLPIILPFFWRGRFFRRRRREGADGAIEGTYRPLDDR